MIIFFNKIHKIKYSVFINNYKCVKGVIITNANPKAQLNFYLNLNWLGRSIQSGSKDAVLYVQDVTGFDKDEAFIFRV